MEITLNKANKIRNALEATEIPVELTFSVRTDDDIKAAYENSLKKLDENTSNLLIRLEVIYTLKFLISECNKANNIDELINKIAWHEAQLSKIRKIIPTYKNSQAQRVDDVVSSVNWQKTRPVEAQKAPERVVIGLYDEFNELYEAIKVDLVKKLDDLKEKRNGMNHTVKVTLPESMVEYLKKVNLL